MAFIAVNAKADVDGSKKGKITPAQNALINAFCLSDKTGILDIGNKCTVENTSIQIQNNQATIKFNGGYIVICGRLIECENGTTFTMIVPSLSETEIERGSIILRYNLLASGEEEFKITTKKNTEGITTQDLNENPIDGVYELELYDYVASSSQVSLEPNYNIEIIPTIGKKLSKEKNDIINSINDLNTYYLGKIETIEERLTNLGFKSPVFTNVNTTYVGTGYKGFTEGNITSLYIPTKASSTSIKNVLLATISNIHLPKEDLTINFNSGGDFPTVYSVKFTTTGMLELSYTSYGHGSESGPVYSGEIVIRIYNGKQSVDNKLNWYTTMQ